ncbi:hypothetical protein BVRB_7g160190 [Beta vulgaris subsp. vulgaris]|nr:hypothetical protein BVRB_7g160190 [Beta vulgaris subsp. vulgaris]
MMQQAIKEGKLVPAAKHFCNLRELEYRKKCDFEAFVVTSYL